MTDTSSLRAFIEARLADDQEWAHGVVRQTEELASGYQSPTWYVSPADCERALREVAAKRAILGMHEAMLVGVEAAAGTLLAGASKVRLGAYENVLRALASVWSDHDQYRPEWSTT